MKNVIILYNYVFSCYNCEKWVTNNEYAFCAWKYSAIANAKETPSILDVLENCQFMNESITYEKVTRKYQILLPPANFIKYY